MSATTNKIESYHAFTKWLDFGGDVINENEPHEQQKRVRYIDLVASAMILQNTVDMMRVLQELHADDEPVSPSDIEYLSPYMTTGVKRFGPTDMPEGLSLRELVDPSADLNRDEGGH